jgi:hypothetical protein
VGELVFGARAYRRANATWPARPKAGRAGQNADGLSRQTVIEMASRPFGVSTTRMFTC